MSSGKLIRTIAFAAITSIGVSCVQTLNQPLPNDPWGMVNIPAGQPIRIRVALSKSDQSFAPLGTEQERGTEVAVREFGPILGFTVVIEQSDPECSTSGGLSASTEISGAQDVVGVVGMTCSSSCIAAAPLFENGHLTSISPSCGAGDLTSPVGHQDSFLTTSYPGSREGTVGGEFAFRGLGARKAAIISYDSIETRDNVSAFKTSFETLGGSISSISTVVTGQASFGPAIDAAMADKPDVLYVPLLPADAVNFVAQIKTSSYSRTAVLGGRYYWSKWFLTKMGNASEGVYAIGPNINGSAYDSVNQFYNDVYGQKPPSSEHAFAYDATNLLLEAIKKSAVLDSQGNLVIGRKALRDAARQTSDYHGSTGNITCTAWGDCSPGISIAVAQARTGQWIVTFIP